MKQKIFVGLVVGLAGLFAVGGFLFFADALEYDSSRDIAADPPFASQAPLELDEKWTKQDDINTVEISKLLKAELVKKMKELPEGSRFVRDAHPKHHGCVKAEFKVSDASPAVFPESARVDLFKVPGSKYNAWIRFSNGNPNPNRADSEGDVRGVAIKVMKAPNSASGSQDFLFMNSPVFFGKGSKDYLRFTKGVTGSKIDLAKWAISNPSLYSIINGLSKKQIGNVLLTNFSSALAYKVGPQAVKYKLTPCATNSGENTILSKDTPNFLRERLVADLKNREACFEMHMQIQSNPKDMPVEDPSKEWDEKKSVPFKVATITIPIQDNIDSDEQLKFCEDIAMTPWHTSPNLRPLGAIGRIREFVYQDISNFRRTQNKLTAEQMKEPVDFTVPGLGQ